MATYKKIGGQAVKTYSSDPPNTYPSAFEGQLYYNSSDGQFKYQTLGAGAWASGGGMNSARTTLQGGGSGNSNAIVAGGYNASTPHRTKSESYNGTSWTETSENNDARQFGGGCGTNTAAIIMGGDPSSFLGASETWDGSSWSEASDLNTGRNQNQGAGTSTAALCVGGGNPGAVTNVESWNGSAWTETSTDLNTAKKYMWATGSNTACLVSGTPATTEQFNGSSWTEVTEANVDHRSGSAAGTSTDGMIWGGDNGPGYNATTEIWDGSSWTEVADLAQARAYTGGTGNSPGTTTALAYGGSTPSQTATAEEWGYSHILKKVTTG